MDEKVQEKKERLLTALEKGMVMVHLDARRPGVNVPEALADEAHLRLNISYRFDPPDLSVGEWGVRSTLSFSGRRFTVAIPWNALFAITSHVTREFWMFPDDLPPELLQNPQAMEGQEEVEPPPPPAKPRAVLRDVSSDLPDEVPEETARPEPKPSPAAAPKSLPRPEPKPEPARAQESSSPKGPEDEPPRRGHLRIVK